MKKLALAMFFILFFCSVVSFASQDIVRTIAKQYFYAVQNKDIDWIKSHFKYLGSEKLKVYNAVFKSIDQKIRNIEIKRIGVFGNKAIVDVGVTTYVKSLLNNDGFVDDSERVLFLEKDTYGNWKIVKILSYQDFDILLKAYYIKKYYPREKSQGWQETGYTVDDKEYIKIKDSKLYYKHIGCFKDRGDPNGLAGRDLNAWKFFSRKMTPRLCIKECAKKGYRYAAVQYGSYCFCGNSYGKFGKANNCNMRCSGNNSKICGGVWANSVYEIMGFNTADWGENFLPPLNNNNKNNDVVVKRKIIDNFNYFNRDLWIPLEWQTLNIIPQRVNIHNSILSLKCDITDRSLFLASKAIRVSKGDIVTIRRRVKVHYANQYFEGGIWFYQTNKPNLILPKNRRFWLSSFGENLFYVTYFHYYYEKPGVKQYVPVKNGFAIYGKNWRKLKNYKVFKPIWNRWFEEEIIFDTGRNIAIYKLNGQIGRIRTINFNKPYLRFIMHSYGWYTGHDVQVDWIKINITKRKAHDKFAYIGCFKDRGDPNGLAGRDLNAWKFFSRKMTPRLCIKECAKKGYRYAAVQYGSYCFCGNSYGKFGKANNCNMRCSGNNSKICGGVWANSVYETSYLGVKNKLKQPLVSKWKIYQCAAYQNVNNYIHKRVPNFLRKDISTIYVTCKVKNVPIDTVLTAQWYYFQPNGEKMFIVSYPFKIKKMNYSGYVTYHMEMPSYKMWPAGEYEVVITEKGKRLSIVRFRVKD